MNRHDEKEIDRSEKRFNGFEGRGRIQGQPHAASGRANRRECFRHVVFRFGLDMHGDGIRAGLEETRQIMIGMLDHEMNIERELRQFAHRGDKSGPKGNIVHEMAVHDVEMEPVGAGFLGAPDFAAELGEVRGEDGRRD
jgi:hypothetical protein